MPVRVAASEETKVELLVPFLEKGIRTTGHRRTIKLLISAYAYSSGDGKERYIILRNGRMREGAYVGIESACLGHIFGMARCDCRDQLDLALNLIAERENSALIYGYDDDGMGNGPLQHINAIKRMDEQDIPLSRVYPNGDRRGYENIGHLITHVLGISSIKLYTNNPERTGALEKHGLHVERVALETAVRSGNRQVLEWKRDLEKHLLEIDGEAHIGG